VAHENPVRKKIFKNLKKVLDKRKKMWYDFNCAAKTEFAAESTL